jgi:hypothetical protein
MTALILCLLSLGFGYALGHYNGAISGKRDAMRRLGAVLRIKDGELRRIQGRL